VANNHFIYGDQKIPYLVCPVPRHQHDISIHVNPDGSVQVDVPLDAKQAEINKAVLKRARWIMNNVEKARKLREHVLPRDYVSGESHFYLGRRYPLKVISNGYKGHAVKLLRGQLRILTPDPGKENVKRLLKRWYREHAREYFARQLSALVEDIPSLHEMPKWRLQVMRKEWGSCSPNGTLTLNPHLVKAPALCVQYVLIHELCHLEEHNHSKRFYRLLTARMPEWKSVKARLDGMAEMLLNE